MKRPSLGTRIATTAALAVIALASASCGEAARTGQAPVILIIDELTAASGAEPEDFEGVLYSDVQTLIEQQINGQTVRVPTIFPDTGRVTMRIALKNPGTITSPLAPSTLNEVTLSRYRVTFVRSDGRNTQGVDIPYSFDGALTMTVTSGGASGVFDLVRHAMKSEPPLRNLVGAGGARFISTIAEITFFGRDQAGNDVTAFATLSVNFGDWADPD
jgi:hypothetical protein